MDAILAFAYGFSNTLKQGHDVCDGENLKAALQVLNFEGATGTVQFDQNQDRAG